MEHSHPYVEFGIRLCTWAKLRFRRSCSQGLLSVVKCLGNRLSILLKSLHFQEIVILLTGSSLSDHVFRVVGHEMVRCDKDFRLTANGQSPHNALGLGEHLWGIQTPFLVERSRCNSKFLFPMDFEKRSRTSFVLILPPRNSNNPEIRIDNTVTDAQHAGYDPF